MKLLTRDRAKRAETFMNSSARPLEAALFAVAFREAKLEWALTELAAYQNEDGGFGHGLEPDLQIPNSSVLATTVALQILRELNVSSDHELVQGAIRYLLATYDAHAKAWPIIPSNADDTPHAPWWQYDPDLSKYLSNPRPEIVGYFFEYPDLVPNKLAESLLADVLNELDALQGKVEMHELLCYLRLLATDSLPSDTHDFLYDRLKPIVLSSVAHNAAAWDQYGLKPLVITPTPASAFADLLAKAIEDNLDYEINKQQEDGSWAPAWSWGNSFPDAWPHSQRAWQGFLTVITMRWLSAYGRLAQG